uniref:hypothetical protein n=1 Tax=Klebsiella pneumoniae TaxID=573 RepID=UPI00129DF00E|nr:hypothetical protein [Klebsiella pneumoniae]
METSHELEKLILMSKLYAAEELNNKLRKEISSYEDIVNTAKSVIRMYEKYGNTSLDALTEARRIVKTEGKSLSIDVSDIAYKILELRKRLNVELLSIESLKNSVLQYEYEHTIESQNSNVIEKFEEFQDCFNFDDV